VYILASKSHKDELIRNASSLSIAKLFTMKIQELFTTFATLATAVSGSALPHARRQNNGTNGVSPVQFVTTTVTQQNGAVQTLVVPVNINIGASPGAVVVPGSGSGVSPGSTTPGSGNTGAGSGASSNSGGVSPVGANTGLVTGSIQNGVCVCNGATIVASGLYVGTVQTQIIVGTSTFVTASPVTTSGVVTVVGGQIVPATPVVTQTFFPVTNTNLPLPAGQAYQLVTLPNSITITIIVTIGPGAGGNGVAPGVINPTSSGIFANGTTATTGLAGATGIAGLPGAAPTSSSAQAALASPIVFTSSPAVASPTSVFAQPTPAPSGSSIGPYGQSPLVNQANFISDILAQHNAYRARNGAPAMVWDDALANVALANVLRNAQTGTLEHTVNQPVGSTPYAGQQTYGENIGFQSGANNPLKIVYLFYQEESVYDRSNPGFQVNAGHFTQLVWVSSTRLGCAYASNGASNPTYYLACEYAPAGNINTPQFFTDNVLASSSPFPSAPADNI
jgi:uncharacterized protein YkwD